MSDMGIGGAFGAEGASDALRQLIQDRLAKQQAEQLTALRQSQEQRLAEEHSANMQEVVAGWNPSAGQALADPEQLSATSH